MTIEDLEARQTEVRGRLQEIDTEFAGEALPDDSRDEWNRLNEEVEANDKLLEELYARRERVEQLSEQPENREAGVGFQTRTPGKARGEDIYDLSTVRASVSSPEEATHELRDRARTAIEKATFPLAHLNAREGASKVDQERCQAHVENLLALRDTEDGELSRRILATGSPAYRRAFAKQMMSRPLSNDEQRALSLASAGGGFAIPFTLDPTIIPTSNSSVNPFRAISRVESLVGSNTWQGVSSAGVTATRTAEAAAATDGAPTLAQPTVTVTKAQVFIPFSIEVGNDWGALESEMARLIQDAKDDEEATSFATGVGTTVFPQGVTVGATNTVAASTGLTITAANLYALEAALPPRFRPNEVFVANRGIYNVVRGIDTGGGAALWLYLAEGLNNQVPAPGNTGALLLGRPAYEASAMQATVVNATKIMVVGDFRYFLIADRVGLTVEVVPHLFGAAQGNLPTGQRGIYAYWRNSSRVLDANAFRALTGTT
jgi:HK97 family phage major capsid protein